jgi:hypothetical protein
MASKVHTSFMDDLETSELPLIVYHPGPARKYWRSLKMMTDHGKPFVLVGVDNRDDFRYPLENFRETDDDGNPKTHQSWDMARLTKPIFRDSAKINKTKIYRKTTLGYEHAIILSYYHDAAREFIDELPYFDIIYLDYPVYTGAWSLKEISYWASHIRDGGLIILESILFNELPASEEYRRKTFKNGIEIEVVTSEFEADFSEGDMISVLKIHSKIKEEKQSKIDFLANCFLERRLDATTLRKMIKSGEATIELPEQENINSLIEGFFWCDPYEILPDGTLNIGPEYPPMRISVDEKTWADPDAYREWLESLIINEKQLRPRIPEFTTSGNIEGINIEHVRGNMLDFSDWLVEQNDMIISGRNEPAYIRQSMPNGGQDEWDMGWYDTKADDPFWRGLFTRRFELLYKSVYLRDVTWSGEDATPYLTRRLVEAAESKFPQCRTVATYSHGVAKLHEIAASLYGYEGSVNRLIIFSIDYDDYDDWD